MVLIQKAWIPTNWECAMGEVDLMPCVDRALQNWRTHTELTGCAPDTAHCLHMQAAGWCLLGGWYAQVFLELCYRSQPPWQ